jgi:hypothetical protein
MSQYEAATFVPGMVGLGSSLGHLHLVLLSHRAQDASADDDVTAVTTARAATKRQCGMSEW